MSKTFDRVVLLLAQADGASTEAERDAYNTKAFNLAAQLGIEVEVARSHQVDKNRREVPTQKRITIGGIVNRRLEKGLSNRVDLFDAIARYNDVKITIAMNSTYVNAYGFPSDIEVVETLYASLLVQMTQAAAEGIKAGKHKDEPFWSNNTWSYRTDARVWKNGFYKGFISQISRRLREARQAQEEAQIRLRKEDEEFFVREDGDDVEAVDDVVTTGTLVLASKRKEVYDYFEKSTGKLKSWKGGSYTSNSCGNGSGREAGSRARLGAPAAIANPKAVR